MYSIFISNKGQRTEKHDLTWQEAMEIALSKLYFRGELINQVEVVIRTKNYVAFSAKNP